MSERLEEFKKQIDFLDDSADMDDFHRFVDTLQIMYEDGEFDWIVKYAKDQTERVQELEKKNKRLADNHFQQKELTQSRVDKFFKLNLQLYRENKELKQQNKRHLEVLKFYADKSMYIRYISALDGLTSDVDFDSGEKARRILEEWKE